MSSPFFSIIIPTLNIRSSLKKLIEQLDKQSFIDIELIIVNQGPILTSKSFNKCTSIFNKIKIINLKKKCLSIAKNLGISVAKGEYIYFIDDDCEIYEDFFHNAHNILNKKKIDLLYGSIYDRDKKVFVLKHWPSGKLKNFGIFRSIYLVSAVTIFYDSKILKQFIFDEDFGINAFFAGNEDVDLIVRILSSGNIKTEYDSDLTIKHPVIKPNNMYASSFGAVIAKNLSLQTFFYFISTIIWNASRFLIYLFMLNFKRAYFYLMSIALRFKGIFLFYVKF